MAPTIGRLALDNGFHGSIPGDWVAPPPQNIQLLEDPYIRRENIYPQAFDSLDILESSEEATWIMHHIKIIDLYQLEVLCFCSNSIIDAIKKTNSTGEITAIPLEVPGELQLANPAFLQFRASVIEQIKKAIA